MLTLTFGVVELVPVIKAENLKVGDTIAGITVYAGEPEPVVKEKSEYPEWLWKMYEEPVRDYGNLDVIAHYNCMPEVFREQLGHYWEFATLNNVQLADKRAKRAYTRIMNRVIKSRSEGKLYSLQRFYANEPIDATYT